jgi:hypothetical protein
MVIESTAISKLADAMASKLAPAVLDTAKGPLARKLGEVKVQLKVGFGRYLSAQEQRYSEVKTIISSNVPVNIRDVYVNLHVSQPGIDPIRDDDFVDIGKCTRRTIFTATAGAGKSMLMRYLFLSYLSSQLEVMPVFIEL